MWELCLRVGIGLGECVHARVCMSEREREQMRRREKIRCLVLTSSDPLGLWRIIVLAYWETHSFRAGTFGDLSI